MDTGGALQHIFEDMTIPLSLPAKVYLFEKNSKDQQGEKTPVQINCKIGHMGLGKKRHREAEFKTELENPWKSRRAAGQLPHVTYEDAKG